MKKIRKAVIPAAGYGTRLLPITKSVPKELLPIGTKPAIQYVVEEAVLAGVEEIILVCNPGKMAVAEYFQPDPVLKDFLEKKGKKKEIEELEKIESLAKFTIVFQKEPLGLGHAVWCAREAVGDENFLVMLPDVLVFHPIPATVQLLSVCGEDDWGLLLEKIPYEKISSYGVIDGKEVKLGVWAFHGAVEKPEPAQVPSQMGILGRYIFPPKVFEYLGHFKKGLLGEVQLTDAIDRLAKSKTGCGVVCEGKVLDVGGGR